MPTPTAAAQAPPHERRDRLEDGQTLAVEGLALLVRVSTRRKRLGLTVEPDGSIVLRVPGECDTERAEHFVRGSRSWIKDKQRLSGQRRQLHPVRTLRDGEVHRYLGRDYRLLLVNDEKADDGGDGEGSQGRGTVYGGGRHADPSVRLKAGRLRLSRTVARDPRKARAAVAAWYGETGLRWMRGRLQPWAARLDVPEPIVEVRDIGRRWGTFRTDPHGTSRLSLHWAVFQLPAGLIDYVIAHELAHTRVAGHGPAYWRFLERALPECRRLKEELDELGRRVWMGDVADSP